jgi:hypothetical protein
MRLWMALEGAVTGAALGLGALAVALAVTHHAGRLAGWQRPIGLAAGVALAGAAVRAVRRIPSKRARGSPTRLSMDGTGSLSAVCLAGDLSPRARAGRRRGRAPGALAPRRAPPPEGDARAGGGLRWRS